MSKMQEYFQGLVRAGIIPQEPNYDALSMKIYITYLENRIAELEDKLESGRLVELPCKVGDTVYEVFKEHRPPFIQQTKVEKIIVTEKGLKLKLARNSFYETSIASLGKTLFLTEEAAEAQIKELQEK